MNSTLVPNDTKQCETPRATDAIRPFQVHFPQEALENLRQRLTTPKVSHEGNSRPYFQEHTCRRTLNNFHGSASE